MGFYMKELRQSAGISRKEAAEIIGVSIHTITSWELKKSRPNFEHACAIADLLECTLDELIGRTPPEFHEYADQRQQDMNEHYESMSEQGKKLASGVVVDLSYKYKDKTDQASSEENLL
jgi:DNA-binding XRE family transcriptional regulator